MKIGHLRWLILTVSFCLLLYGSYFGLDFGKIIPAFSCRFVFPRSGTCFLEPLQTTLGTLTLSDALVFAWRFFLFSILVILLGRAWCGWLCPMGFIQDLLDRLRKLLGLGYVRFSNQLNKQLRIIKWIFLAVVMLLPVWVAFPVFFPNVAVNLRIPFCQICPGQYILPLFSLGQDRIMVDFSNATRTVMTSLGLLISIIILLGALVKRRFWCPFCPLGLLMSLYRKIAFIKLRKNDATCTHCGICANVCPVEIEEIYLSRGRTDVTFANCILCLKCIEYCPEDDALYATFLGRNIFTSSAEAFFTRPPSSRKPSSTKLQPLQKK